VQKKTKAMAAVRNTQAPSLSVEHKDIEFVEHFQYLGSNLSRDDDADYDIYTRIGKASSMLNVFNRRCLREIMGVLWKDHMTNEEHLLSLRRWGPAEHCGSQAKKIHRTCTAPPDVKTSQPGNRLDSRGRK